MQFQQETTLGRPDHVTQRLICHSPGILSFATSSNPSEHHGVPKAAHGSLSAPSSMKLCQHVEARL